MMLVPIRLCRKYDCILFKPLFATGFHYGLDERGLGDGRDIDLKFLRALESLNIEHHRNRTFRCDHTTTFLCDTVKVYRIVTRCTC
ncbi:hypothetical protein FIU89_15430 [Roseovarius sp. THAF27]|nr:hypothetical protein FIU89_15430 [Roseovarius sp. THAF27]